MKKRILFTVFVLSMLLIIAAAPVYAVPEVTVILDGNVMSFDVPPQIVNDRTLAPLRFVAEAFGGTVAWDDNSQTASISMGDASAAPTSAPEPTPAPAPEPTPETTETPESTLATPSSGNIDSNLIGHWVGSGNSGGSYYVELNHYFFFNDGAFYYYSLVGKLYARSGNYSVSDGSIYFTNVVFANDGYQEGFRRDEADSFVDYEIIADPSSEQLKVSNTGGNWMGAGTLKRASMEGYEDIGPWLTK